MEQNENPTVIFGLSPRATLIVLKLQKVLSFGSCVWCS